MLYSSKPLILPYLAAADTQPSTEAHFVLFFIKKKNDHSMQAIFFTTKTPKAV